MQSGNPAEINPWGAEMFLTLRTVEPETATEQSAYDKWLDQTSDRQDARRVQTSRACTTAVVA